jgi:hypothetical protein
MASRKNKRKIMVEDDIDAAEIVTFRNVTVTSSSGSTQTKRVMVELFPRVEQEVAPPAQSPEPEQSFATDIDMGDAMPDSVPRHRKVREQQYCQNVNY